MREGFIDNCYTLIEAFPALENTVMTLIQQVLTRQITPTVFSKKIIQIMEAEIEKNVEKVINELEGEEALSVTRGMFDCVRYKTQIRDAAIEWQTDEKFLKRMLEHLPTDNRVEYLQKLLAIEVRRKVKIKREIM
jgi:hypothetical protein